MTEKEQKSAAKAFAAFWKDKGYEKGESQAFWMSLLRDVYGIEHPEQFISFEDQVKLDHTSFIDGYIGATHVMIEQKGLNKDLRKGIKQSDGSVLSPFQQAKRYAAELPYVSCWYKKAADLMEGTAYPDGFGLDQFYHAGRAGRYPLENAV